MVDLKTERNKERSKGYRYIITLVLFFILCFGNFLSLRAEGEVTDLSGQGIVVADSPLNVREGPGKDFDKIASVKPGDSLSITGQSDNGWYRIEIDGKIGYVSDKYVELWEEEEEQKKEKEEGEPEEGYHGLRQSPYVIKIAVITGVILVVVIMIIITLKGIRKMDAEEEDAIEEDEDAEEEEDEDDEDDEDEDDEYDEDEEDYEGYESGEYEDDEDIRDKIIRQTKRETKTYIIREEDYRVNIDPSFFDTKTSIEQPPMVTGYLEHKEIEEAARKAENAGKSNSSDSSCAQGSSKQEELDKAMEKLNELQKEIERLKKQ